MIWFKDRNTQNQENERQAYNNKNMEAERHLKKTMLNPTIITEEPDYNSKCPPNLRNCWHSQLKRKFLK